jgi:hypothetical protein
MILEEEMIKNKEHQKQLEIAKKKKEEMLKI